MSIRPTDPLLLAGTVVTLVMQTAMALAGVAITIAIPGLLIYRDKAQAEFARETGSSALLPLPEIVGVMLLIAVVVALMFVFFGRLRRIVATVGEGDPFQPENADRLTQMGWLMIVVQLLLIPAAALGHRILTTVASVAEANAEFDGSFDFGGILLVIVLFILARVLRHGAAMREDLEGTV
jgi:hypothetical protein